MGFILLRGRLDSHYPPLGRVGLSGPGRGRPLQQVIADSAVVAFPLPGRYCVRPSRREGGTARKTSDLHRRVPTSPDFRPLHHPRPGAHATEKNHSRAKCRLHPAAILRGPRRTHSRLDGIRLTRYL